MQGGAMGGTWTPKPSALFRKATGNPLLELTGTGAEFLLLPARLERV